jgi:hypothetical protein
VRQDGGDFDAEDQGVMLTWSERGVRFEDRHVLSVL